MKKIYLLSVMMFITSMLFSQAWLKNLPQQKSKSQLTFFDYKTAFDQYWEPYNVERGFYIENGVKKKAIGWKQFKRWEYDMESKIDPASGEFPVKTAAEIYEGYLKTNPQSKAAAAASWSSLGTSSSTGGYAGVGRLNCIAYHPTNTNTYWVGAASGGLWVTTNNGTSWTCLTDNNGVLAVSDIVIPSDFATSNTIYIATGDKDHWDNNSIGVLKSTDGGVTWNTTGLSYALSGWNMVYRLLLDPSNNQTLIAATSNGVYKTTNGGTTWSTQLTTTSFIDMEYKPGDFNTLYGSTTSGSIYLSTNGGTSWTQTFIDANAYRIELAVSANQPTWVYALAVNSVSGLYGIYKSINSGSSYSQIFAGTTKNLLGWYDGIPGSDDGGQGWYDLSLAASPSNANTLLVGGVNTWRSTNGGTSWALVNHWYGGYGAQAVHADKHSLNYRNNGDLFECNDGGVYISTNNGTSWTDKTNGMVISQMYKLGVSQTVSNEVITGLQDNGTKLISGGTWSDVKGGDGMECLIDYTNVNIQYGTYTNGQIDITTNHWASSSAIEPSGAGSGAWVTPYIIDPTNPMILYAGYANVWKTVDRGTNWTQISTMNTSNLIRSMAIAPSNTQVIYVADQSTIWKTTNGGASWSIITGSLPVGSGSITYIAVKNNDANTLWVTLSGYSASTVYQSINAGTSWTNISAGLPQLPAYTIVQNKQSASEVQLYVGTELGVYFKKGTDNWAAYNTGLPNVQIGELEIYYASNPQQSKLRAATFGRGLWESLVYYSSTAMTYVSSTVTQNNISSVAPNQVNQEIISIQIVTNGDLTPLSATSFTFNTTGSTSPVTDITNSKLYFTGTSNAFATTTQFGATSVSPNGTFTITGTQILSGGTNYFWLAYDVPESAVLNNSLDAQCTSLTVGTAKTPTVTNPAGNRQILVSYCSANGITCDEYISDVVIGTISNSSTCSSGGYANYTSLLTSIVQGASVPITVSNGILYTGDRCGIWVDWNSNGDFSDDQAIVVTGTPGPFSATIACPANASIGSKRMRIRIHYTNEATSPCGTAVWGEVEDYTITVTALPTKTLNLNVFLEGLYPVTAGSTMNKAQNGVGNQYSGTIADQITVELHNSTTPYALAGGPYIANLNTDGTASLSIPGTLSANYYIVVKHRNSIQTWSAAPVSFAGSTVSYNFSTTVTAAYGNNLKQKGTVFLIYCGDVNQDGAVNALDQTSIQTTAVGFTIGYLTTDVNGDGIVDAFDLVMADNNAAGFVVVKKP
jgi:hypothetical protein